MTEEPIRDQPFERALPNSSEAERALLGTVQNDNNLFPQVIDLVMPDDFYVPSHRRIYLSMIRLFEVGSEINAVLIAEELKKENQLESVGGISFILSLTHGLPPTSDVEGYCKIIRDKSVLRRLIKASNKITQEALAEEDFAEVILEHAGKGIFDITLDVIKKSLNRIGLLAHKSMHKAHQIQQMGTAITGIPSGFNDLDAMTLGFQRQDMIIMFARPSMGKTAAAVMLALNAAVQHGLRVAFFSLEMSEEQITMRMLCALARVDIMRFRSGHLTGEEWNRLAAAEQQLANAKIWIDDTPGITVLQLKAKCRRLIAETGEPLDLIIVDYVQLMGNDGTRNHYSREQEVSANSRDLKQTFKELNAAGVVDAQSSRKSEDRADKRPQLPDLRESGSLEQDADVVIGLYREDMYKPKDQPQNYNNIAEWIVLKQRNGPTGTVALRFDPPSARFESLYHNQGENQQ